jgi:predicted amidohydrolase
VLFPECALGHYFDDPVLAEGPEVSTLADLARERQLFLALGIGEEAEGKRYSSYLLLGPEGMVGRHRKTRWQTDRCPIDLGEQVCSHLWAGVRVGVLICSESWHPDNVAACLAKHRAELLIVPAATGPEPGESERSLYKRMLVANARSLSVPAISVGAVGRDLVGGCMVVDSTGAVCYWQLSSRPEMHRLDLQLPEGNVL